MLAHFSAAIHGLGKLDLFDEMDRLLTPSYWQFLFAHIVHKIPSKLNPTSVSIITPALLESPTISTDGLKSVSMLWELSSLQGWRRTWYMARLAPVHQTLDSHLTWPSTFV